MCLMLDSQCTSSLCIRFHVRTLSLIRRRSRHIQRAWPFSDIGMDGVPSFLRSGGFSPPCALGRQRP